MSKVSTGIKNEVRAISPLEAALKAGGCTMEPEIGWWTFSPDPVSWIGDELTKKIDHVVTRQPWGAT